MVHRAAYEQLKARAVSGTIFVCQGGCWTWPFNVCSTFSPDGTSSRTFPLVGDQAPGGGLEPPTSGSKGRRSAD
jgi:hypothetical protein